MWDFVTDHRLVVADVCPPRNNAQVRIPPRLFDDTTYVRRVLDSYKTSLPIICDNAKAAQTIDALDTAVDDSQTALLRPWLQFCRRKPPRFRPGWTHELDRLANIRSTLLRKSERGNEAARMAAKEIDRTIKRRQRARKRALDRSAADRAAQPLHTATSVELNDTVRGVLNAHSQSLSPSPATYLQHLQTVFRNDPIIHVRNFNLDSAFEATVTEAIMDMAPGRAAGPDGIAPRILQVAPELVANCESAIWRTIGRIGCVPAALSLGRVTPVFKKGDHKIASNYRPICILNVVRRAMSAAINRRIRREITFHHRQWGFRRNMGTEHAIAHLAHRRRQGAQHVVLLDLKGAYDRTPRGKLLEIVCRRLSSDLAGLISAILVPGEIFVSGAPEKRIQLTSGVPQGDPLSPTLFNIFMDEYLKKMDNTVRAGAEADSCYADDVVLSAVYRSEIQRYLHISNEWSKNNDMEWNVKKCVEVVPPQQKLLLATQEIPQSTEVRYLGITLDWSGVSTGALHDRLQRALVRMGRISRAIPLRSLPFERRRYVIQLHVLPLVDYASHLCPLPASARATAALLERRACWWILDHPVRSHQTIRARALARLAPLEVRRSGIAYRRIYGARTTLSLDEPNSFSAQRARLVLAHPTVQEVSSLAPHPPHGLTDALNRLYRKEWKRTMPGRRPVPTDTKLPPALQHITPPLLSTISAFYLNAIPAQAWYELSTSERQQLTPLLARNSLNHQERTMISQVLSKISLQS